MRSAKIIEFNKPLKIEEGETPKPRGSEVLYQFTYVL